MRTNPRIYERTRFYEYWKLERLAVQRFKAASVGKGNGPNEARLFLLRFLCFTAEKRGTRIRRIRVG